MAVRDVRPDGQEVRGRSWDDDTRYRYGLLLAGVDAPPGWTHDWFTCIGDLVRHFKPLHIQDCAARLTNLDGTPTADSSRGRAVSAIRSFYAHGEVRSAERNRTLRTAGLGLCTARILSAALASSTAMVGGHGLSPVLSYAALCAATGRGLVRRLERVVTVCTPTVRDGRRPRLLLCAVPVLCAAGTWPALLYLLHLPEATLYASSFVAPGRPGAVVFFLAVQHMSQVGTAAWVSLAIVTAYVLLLAGQGWSWRPSAVAARGEFVPVRPPGWLWARLGAPAGLVASVLLTPWCCCTR
ncbi:hypothetical protein [Streptomyces triticisoli]|jgi:hypothetical protein|uniref:hypothetical protein n=1 Tax=Streptomyces triticisoli TaxID=2182797 RepID=UPI000DD7194E|nr:hypothetical protein [Streptomyces triticisoli]